MKLFFIIEGLFGSCYFGLGRGLGTYAGGFLAAELGYPLTWALMAGAAGSLGAAVALHGEGERDKIE